MGHDSMIKKLWDIANPFAAILLCMLAGTMIGTMGFGLLTGLHGLGNDDLLILFPWLTLVISLISSVLTVLVLRKIVKLDQVRFGFDRHDWKPADYAFAILGAAAAAHIWSTLIYASGIQKLFTGYEETAGLAFQGQNLILLILATVIAAPVAEELVFRCLIYRRAKAYFGKTTACMVSAVLFGVYHANVIQFIYAIGFTVMLVFLYEKSRNILAPILAHAGANLYAVLLEKILPEYSVKPYVPMLIAEMLLAVGAGVYISKKAK